MKNQYFVLLFVVLTSLSSCQDKSKLAAEMSCECNSGLVEYLDKMEKFKAENDVNSIALMQKEGDILIKKAEKCLTKMETEIGKKKLDNKDFEVKVMAQLKEQCPKVFEHYKKVSLQE